MIEFKSIHYGYLFTTQRKGVNKNHVILTFHVDGRFHEAIISLRHENPRVSRIKRSKRPPSLDYDYMNRKELPRVFAKLEPLVLEMFEQHKDKLTEAA